MKRITAVILAAIIVLCYAVTAFADTAAEGYKCPFCGAQFEELSDINEHIADCFGIKNKEDKILEQSADGILESLADFFSINKEWAKNVNGSVVKLYDLINNIGLNAVTQTDVIKAIEDLETKITEAGISGNVLDVVTEIINSLKREIKDIYASQKETEIHEETTAAEPVATGSSGTGVWPVAVLLVLVAAVYVCRKKKNPVNA